MTGKEDGRFKAYHPMVVKAYEEMDNFLVADDGRDTGWCCIYFSSNGIYNPSDEATFEREIVVKNRFEFYGMRLAQCSKHIFLRDVHKQWYLKGISKTCDSIEELAAFLKEQTSGLHVITLGSSAGGYAAALLATLIHADYAICIDAQFSLYDEAIFGSLEKNPFVDELKDTPASRYFNLNEVLGDVPVYYFHSAFSPFDQRAEAVVKGNRAVRSIPFKSAAHGGPFDTALYQYLFSLPKDGLERLVGKMHHPRLFLLRHIFCPGVLKRIVHRAMK